MGLNQYKTRFIFRLFCLFVLLTALAFLCNQSGYYPTKVFLVMLVVLSCMEFWLFVEQQNQAIVRFLNDLRSPAAGERFQINQQGDGFDEFYAAANLLQEQKQQQRIQQQQELRIISAQMELIPIPLVRIDYNDRVYFNNRAARRLFTGKIVKRIEDFKTFGEDFERCMRNISAGEKQLVEFQHDDIRSLISVTCSEVQTSPTSKDKLIALHNIQSELDKSELDSWKNLVNVLTHEIMNSITPVTSLAQSVTTLIDELVNKNHRNEELHECLLEIRQALYRLALRSNNLMDFVQHYRKISALPKPQIAPVEVMSLLQDIVPLVTCGWVDKGINIDLHFMQKNLIVNVDRKMIEQVLINLLKNAEDTLENINDPRVQIDVKVNRIGRVLIQISDNGPGVDDEYVKKIFLPFFTTKSSGSGIGLALARTIMMANGGSIEYKLIAKGACFNLIF